MDLVSACFKANMLSITSNRANNDAHCGRIRPVGPTTTLTNSRTSGYTCSTSDAVALRLSSAAFSRLGENMSDTCGQHIYDT